VSAILPGSTFIGVPQYPNVPPLPGVPPLLQPPGGLQYILPILATIAGAGFGPQLSQWGIFGQDGTPLLIADSVFSVDYARDYKISDYPQEQGSFQSYNKVQTPYRSTVTFLVGDPENRVEFLNSIEAACASLNLYVVVTPEITYANANLTHYSYRRAVANGVTLLSIDVGVEEVRITATSQTSTTTTPTGNVSIDNLTISPTTSGTLSNTQSVNGAATQNNGSVQTSAPPSTASWANNIGPT
jgi:hypothetical protein